MSGIVQSKTGATVGQSYVVRAPLKYTDRARPELIATDETNGGQIITRFRAPWFYGYHDGGDGASALSDSAAPDWSAGLVGATVYNITDGSSATVTATGKSVTGTLSGGTDNDWDDGDEYRIVPSGDWLWCEPFTFQLPTTARNGSAVDCTAWNMLVDNAGSGELYINQVEIQKNLIDNPSFETGGGDPWIPDGWNNSGLDAGESVQELTTVHSGSSSVKYTTGANLEGVFVAALSSAAVGDFLTIGGYYKSANGDSTNIGSGNYNHAFLQRVTGGPLSPYYLEASSTVWKHYGAVYQEYGGDNVYLNALSGATGDRFVDDIYAFLLNPVSLTVTPASEANSTVGTGLLVNGSDAVTQPIPAGKLTATSGEIRWPWTPNHSAGVLESFGTTNPIIGRFQYNNNNYISVYALNDTEIRLGLNLSAAWSFGTWNSTGEIVAGTTYQFKIIYDSTSVRLYVDNALKATATPGGGLDWGTSVPHTAYWGARPGVNEQIDAIFG